MKKIFYLLIINTLLVFCVSFAHAQDSGTILPPPQAGTTLDSYTNPSPTPLLPILAGQVGDNQNERNYPLTSQKINLNSDTSSDNTTVGKENEGNKDTLDQATQNQINNLKSQVQGIKDKIDVLRQGAMQKFQDLKDKISTEKNQTKAKAKQAILVGREDALVRFDNAIQRIEDLRVKVEGQVTRMESQGIIVTDDLKGMSITAESKLNDARTKVVEANNLLAKSINQLSKDDKTKLASLTKDIQGLIKDAQKTLNDEVFGLRKLINPNANPPLPTKSDTIPNTGSVSTPTISTSSSQ